MHPLASYWEKLAGTTFPATTETFGASHVDDMQNPLPGKILDATWTQGAALGMFNEWPFAG